MADSILRLRVQSEEYDNKLKRASEAIQRYADKCREAGGTLEHLDDGILEFTRALGGMETVSKSAKGSLGELTKSFTELKVQYNKLTDAEKQSPFGQALKSSLDQLKGRIQDGKKELNNINKEVNGSNGLTGALDAVAGKLGVSTQMLTKFGGAMAVITTATKVLKDAFFQSESNIDEWGRTIKGAEGAYDIFLQTLNNGNWSNFFSNLSQAITGARDLYDAFDRLNSIKANNAVVIATTQAEIQQLRLLKQQGQDVDDKIKAATARLKVLQSQSTNAGINAGKSQVVNTLRNGVNSIGGAPINNATLNRVADNIAKQGQAYFDYMKRRAADLEKKGMVTKTQTINDSQGGTYQRQYKEFDINALTKEQQKQYAIAKVVTERETALQKGLTVWSQAVNEQASNAREQFRDNRYALQGSGGTTGGKGGSNTKTELTELQQNQKTINDLTQEYVKLGDLSTEEARNRQEEIQKEIQLLKERNGLLGLRSEQAQGRMLLKASDVDTSQRFNGGSLLANPFASDTNAMETGGLKLTLDDKTMKTVMDQISKTLPTKKEVSVTQEMGKIAGGISSIVGGIESLGVEIPEGLKGVLNGMQSMISILSGISTVVLAIEAIAGADALIPFARGGVVHAAGGWSGMVPGNMFSGDQVPAMLDSGELVLNKFQQEALAANLNGGGQTMHLTGTLSGEDILVAVNRVGKRKGYGEVCFFKE